MHIDASNGWRGSIPNWERFSHARRHVEWVAWEHSELGTIQPCASTRRMGGVGAFQIGNDSATPTMRRMGGVGAFQIGNDSATRINASNGWRGCIPNWDTFSHTRLEVPLVTRFCSGVGTEVALGLL